MREFHALCVKITLAAGSISPGPARIGLGIPDANSTQLPPGTRRGLWNGMLLLTNSTLRRMKEIPCVRFALFLAALLLQPPPSNAITFTGDAQIGVYDTSFDGLDIVVTNCTLT